MEFDEPQTERPQGNGTGSGSNATGTNDDGSVITPLDIITGKRTQAKQSLITESNRDAGSQDTGQQRPSDDGQTDTDETDSEAPSERSAEWTGDWSPTPVEPSTELANNQKGLIRQFFQTGTKPHVLNDKLIAEFCLALKTSIFVEIAAAQCDINVNSLKEWLRQGRRIYDYLWHEVHTHSDGTKQGAEQLEMSLARVSEAEWLYYELFTKTQKAKADGEKEDLAFIAAARHKDWKAAAYRLKIRNRQLYGDGPQTAITNIQQNGDNTNTFNVVDYAQFVNDESQESIEVEAIEDDTDERTQT